MNKYTRVSRAAGLGALLSLTLSAHAQQPPDTVYSDASGNTASGSSALLSNSSGTNNSAFGNNALRLNAAGCCNSAFGLDALELNASGENNSAFGDNALANTTGNDNAGVGSYALYANTTGANNTAFGYLALYSNTVGKGNAAQGTNALYSNTTGIRNLGIGSNALFANTTGGYNIALGFDAGYNVTTGSNNIEIGASGAASDNGTIQIGVQGTQTSTTIAGIYGEPVSGSAVYVTSAGKLGVQASSERYKTDIVATPDLWERLARLRPVTFHYRNDAKNVPQYGLIAEEVDKVFPELVIRDESGKVQGVHYEELAPMLLSLAQRQQKILGTQERVLAAQTQEMSELKQQFAKQLEINRATLAALRQLQTKNSQVAMR